MPSTTLRKPIATTVPSTSATQEKSVSLVGAASHSWRNVPGSTLVRSMNRLTAGSLRKDSSCSISLSRASRRWRRPTRIGQGLDTIPASCQSVVGNDKWVAASRQDRRPRVAKRLRLQHLFSTGSGRSVSDVTGPATGFWVGSGAGGHVGGECVVGVAVELVAGSVVAHGGAGVGVAGGD